LADTYRHRSTPWQREFHELPPGFTVNPTSEGFLVVGPCPGCGGRIRKDWVYGSGDGYKGTRDQPKPIPGPRVVRCICGNAHDDRPSTEQFEGCGAYWTVWLP
jgi:hypothetical protein